jgi:hypothetical protein
VPLICAGQGIAKDSVVHSAVSTVDLAPTFLDFAGVLDTAPPGMSRFSLRGVLQAPTTVALLRQTVEFGLNNFRGVVRTLNDTHTLKFFCCSAAGGGCPGSTPADRAGFSNTTDEYHLFNIANDRFETPVRETHAIFLMITCQDRLGANTRTTVTQNPPACFARRAASCDMNTAMSWNTWRRCCRRGMRQRQIHIQASRVRATAIDGPDVCSESGVRRAGWHASSDLDEKGGRSAVWCGELFF